MKTLTILVVVLLAFAVPAFAGHDDPNPSYNLSATSQAAVASGSGVFGTGLSGSFGVASNTSSAYALSAGNNSGGAVETGAISSGFTLGGAIHGYSLTNQSGSAHSSITLKR